jgi:Rod binding domain-containing protein
VFVKINNSLPLKEAPQDKLAKVDRQLKDASKMYEQHFLNEMVKSMRSTIHRDDGFIKPNMAENIFQEKLDQEYTDAWSKKGGIGLADMIYSQLHERIFPNKKDFSKPVGPLPLDKANHSFEIKVEKKNDGGQVLFHGDASSSPLVQPAPVQNPWKGRIQSMNSDLNGWNYATIEHSNHLRSQLAFQGSLAALKIGEDVEEGQAIGILSRENPTLRWDVSENTV